ncbi:hypothetical protein VP01_2731g3 [Puccinia sorghi]|uniref:Uncharacterized protein n=1 Tax=Puccinia sorghi TaxID=27349 RepID=A0A0L6V3A1_9BASI|nr:hypothetical protein VP01_2731g3 [Puccinia sorghi]
MMPESNLVFPSFQDLIQENFPNGKKGVHAMKNSKLSQSQIPQIKFEDSNLVRTHKAGMVKFTHDMKTELLHQPNQKSATNLLEMASLLKEKFNLTMSTQAISNIIHNMDILWQKSTTYWCHGTIPRIWSNKIFFGV